MELVDTIGPSLGWLIVACRVGHIVVVVVVVAAWAGVALAGGVDRRGTDARKE